MWKQISLSDALRAFLSGQTVKVVDFTEDTVLSLQDVLQRFEAGAVMFAEDAPQKYNPPDNATEAELVDWIINGSAFEPEPEPPTATDAGLPVQNVKQTISDAVKQVTEDLVPTAAAPEPPRVTREKKQLDEAEKAYQSRKISDLGKLRSLRAAGWDVEKIATEFGCSGQTVRNTMKREGIG